VHPDDQGWFLTLPSRTPPDPAAVTESAAAAPVLARFRALHAFCAPPGRRLTSRGNLTLADARHLVAHLGTGDVVDKVYGNRTFAVRSATHLEGLELTVRWAERAGVVRIDNGRLVAAPAWALLARSPEAAFQAALTALLEVGPLAAWWSRPGPQAEIVQGCLPHLLAVLWAADELADFEEFLDVTAQVLDDQVEPEPWSTFEERREWARPELDGVVDALTLAGVLVRQGARVEPGAGDERRRVGGRLSLTPAGWAALPEVLAGFGYGAPLVGAWAEHGAEALLEACAEMDVESMEAELSAWLERRRPAQAVAELTEALAGTKSPEVRLLGFHALGRMPEVAEPQVRRLAMTPAAGHARLWLVEHGYEAAVVAPEDPPEAVLEVLGAALDQGGFEALVEALAAAGTAAQQVALVGRLWRVQSETVLAVLEGIGHHHPDGEVARAARRGVLQHRSWLAGS
jgi:hypothetical protein